MEDLIFFIVIAVIWGLSQLAKAGRGTGPRQAPRRAGGPRPAGPASGGPARASRDQVTLEEWMERVRTGQAAPRPREPQHRPEPISTSAAPEDPEAILQQWQRRTQQPRETHREVPVRTPPPTVRPHEDPYATRQEQIRRAQEAEREQRKALAAERERERRAQEQQEAQRRERKHRARARTARRPRGGRAVAVPHAEPAPQQLLLKETPLGTGLAKTGRSDRAAYRRPSEVAPHRHKGGLNLTHDGLRQGILLAEILGPPVALRRPGSGSPFARVGAPI